MKDESYKGLCKKICGDISINMELREGKYLEVCLRNGTPESFIEEVVEKSYKDEGFETSRNKWGKLIVKKGCEKKRIETSVYDSKKGKRIFYLAEKDEA